MTGMTERRLLSVAAMSKLFGAFALACGLGSAAHASTTVSWTGSNNFNDASITFGAFTANELIDITGTGQYEGCCSGQTTGFSLYLRLNGVWKDVFDWSYKPDETPRLLANLVPPTITFAPSLVSGIKLTSDPNGKPSNDFNYTNFNFTTYLSRDDYYHTYQSRYSSYDEYLGCGDYENYVRHVTNFVFDNAAPTPLPGALVLMAPVLAGGFFVSRRRRPKPEARRSGVAPAS